MTSQSITRTNYFKLRSDKVDAFKTFCDDRLSGNNSFSITEKDGAFWGWFGDDNLSFLEPRSEVADDRDDDESGFVQGLQSFIADDDAAIISTITWEGLRYCQGHCTIVTASAVEYLDLSGLSIKKAAEMLGNPNWNTRNEY